MFLAWRWVSKIRIKGGPDPLVKEINLRIDFATLFELTQKTCQIFTCLSWVIYVRARGHCESSCRSALQISGCQKCAIYGFRLLIASEPGSSSPERPGSDKITRLLRVNHGLAQLALVPPLLVLCLVSSNKKSMTKGSKHFKRWYRGSLRQIMADSWCCHLGSLKVANWVSFDFNVSYSSCWGYSLINILKFKSVS